MRELPLPSVAGSGSRFLWLRASARLNVADPARLEELMFFSQPLIDQG